MINNPVYNINDPADEVLVGDFIDFYSVHIYGFDKTTTSGATPDAAKLTSDYLKKAHEYANGKPIFIGEFGAGNGDFITDQDTIGSKEFQANIYNDVLKSVDSMKGNNAPSTKDWPTGNIVKWENTAEGGWLALDGTPPPCPEPLMFRPPTDLKKATSLLYPGQERRGEKFMGKGGNYKPHGGFRFDGLKYNEVQVVSPFDGYVYRGSRYLQDGEIQYAFDLINSCGVMVRLGHLRELSPTFQAIADSFPEARNMDSRTERVTSYPKVTTREVIATGVGFKNSQNIGFDWGCMICVLQMKSRKMLRIIKLTKTPRS